MSSRLTESDMSYFNENYKLVRCTSGILEFSNIDVNREGEINHDGAVGELDYDNINETYEIKHNNGAYVRTVTNLEDITSIIKEIVLRNREAGVHV